jgi:hypothetical protein
MGPMGQNADGKEPLFEVTKNGSPAVLNTDYKYTASVVGGIVHWEMALLTNCTLRFRRVGKVDLCVIGAGYDGGKGSISEQSGVGSKTEGGAGGDGGKMLRESNVQLPRNMDLPVTIGASNGAASSLSAYSSSDGNAGAKGGAGAYANGIQTSDNGKDGADGALPYAIGTSMLFPGVKFGPGGGGGGTKNGDYVSKSAGYGGDDGGGDGGTSGSTTGANGAANSGAGAGGGYTSQYIPYDGGIGGSGAVLIRDHREA